MSKAAILRKASDQLKTLVQNDIISKGLVKTGRLVRSIEAEVVENGDDLTIEIGAVYYYAFLDNGTRYIQAYNITEDVTNSREFNDLMTDTVVALIELRLEEVTKN